MATAFLTLAQAAVTVLTAATALAGGRVQLNRGMPMPLEQGSSIDVQLRSSRGTGVLLDGTAFRWETAIDIQVRVRASAGVEGATAVDALLSSIFERFAAAAAPAGAITWSLDPAVQWEVEEAEQLLATATLALRVTHLTTAAAQPAT